MLLAATIAIWVSFFVVAAAAVALRPEPTATRPGGPPYALLPLVAAAVFVPTDLLLVSTLVDRIRLAPLAMVVVVFVLLLLVDAAIAEEEEEEEVGCVGCNRFSLLTGVTEMEAAAAAAVKAVFCCC